MRVLFRVRKDNANTENVNEGGQIEVAAGTELDYETKTTYDGHADGRGLLRGQRHYHGDYHGHRHGRSAGLDRRSHHRNTRRTALGAVATYTAVVTLR